jgi:hypothetical protein
MFVEPQSTDWDTTISKSVTVHTTVFNSHGVAPRPVRCIQWVVVTTLIHPVTTDTSGHILYIRTVEMTVNEEITVSQQNDTIPVVDHLFLQVIWGTGLLQCVSNHVVTPLRPFHSNPTTVVVS